jgi:dephospho-CoA kinase
VNGRHDKPLRIGLTGGIASGKSTVADMFAGMGIPVIDTDVIAREVVNPGEPALAEIREAFGAGVIAADGTLDRGAMRAIVFGDDGARRRLEGILHPRIRKRTVEQADAAGTQVARLLERDAESEQQARRILAAQSTRAQRLAIADDVISNDGDFEGTRQQVQALHRRYLLEAAAREN